MKVYVVINGGYVSGVFLKEEDAKERKASCDCSARWSGSWSTARIEECEVKE